MWLALEKKADIEEACLPGKAPAGIRTKATTTPKLIPGVLRLAARRATRRRLARRRSFVVLSNEAEIAE